MGQDSLQIVGIDCVEHIVEILPRWHLVSGKMVGKVDREAGLGFQIRPQPLNRELIILWDLDRLDLAFLEKLLLILEDHSQKVLVDMLLRRQIILHYWWGQEA